MSEEKHDNLPLAEGSENNENLIPQTHEADQAETFDETASVTTQAPDSQIPEQEDDDAEAFVAEDHQPDIAEPLDAVFATEGKENDDVPEDLLTDELPHPEADADIVNEAADSESHQAAETLASEKNIDDVAEAVQSIEREPVSITVEGTDQAMSAIEQSNAEESEDDTLKDRHDLPMRNYDELSMEELTDELEKLTQTDRLMSVKDHVEEIKRSFLSKYHHLIEEKRAEHVAEHEGDGEDFHYTLPLKARFDQLY